MMVITLESFCSPFQDLDVTRFVQNYSQLFVNYLCVCMYISFLEWQFSKTLAKFRMIVWRRTV